MPFEGNKIYKSLNDKDLKQSRINVSYIVGRETSKLNEEEIIKATVETIAENTVDGVISPMFYCIIGGLFGLAAPMAYMYKAINTLDSMVGYKNDIKNIKCGVMIILIIQFQKVRVLMSAI